MDGTSSDVVALTCWKDIANYLGKGVRTVQRWEQEFGLPVRRPNGISHKSPVAADPRDLDLWLKSRWSVRAEKAEDGPPEPRANGFVERRTNGSAEPRPDGLPERRTNGLVKRRPDGLIPNVLIQELHLNIRRSNALQAKVREIRRQHHDLVRQLAAATICLTQTCNQRMAPPRESDGMPEPSPAPASR